jgi:hypothetical protein
MVAEWPHISTASSEMKQLHRSAVDLHVLVDKYEPHGGPLQGDY